MFDKLPEFAKKYGIWAALFIVLLIYVLNGYEAREAKYMAHESEYHKIIDSNNKIMTEAQRQMSEQQKTLEGFKLILEVKLDQIQKELEMLKR